ncbi:GPO family capsid scaffolding protein [Aliivibrio sifiae]
MFHSEPICILSAGKTVDGREISQQVIDDIAETYNPKTYNARINEEHWSWSEKFGSVLSVEKRADKLFAILKPNSRLLNTIEKGQLLHTSCEYIENFSDSGKAYLTGLALTDEPASLGTTEIHLSTKDKGEGKIYLSSGATIGKELLGEEEPTKPEDIKLLARIKQWLCSNNEPTEIIEVDGDIDMNEELKEVLQAQTGLITALSAQVISLNATVKEALPQAPEKVVPETNTDETELSTKVEALSTKLDEMVTTLSKITDENPRRLAGEDTEDEYL